LSEKWDNIWLFSAENSNDSANAIFASTNGEKWEQYSTVESTNGARRWWEAQIIEAADGTLIHMSRLEEGADDGMQLAYSYDGGETWTLSYMDGFNTDTFSFTVNSARAAKVYKCVITDIGGNTVETGAVSVSVG
jgi:hypothetical protein